MEIRPVRESDMAFVRETTCKARWPRVLTNPGAAPADRVYSRPITWHEWERAHGPTVDEWIADGNCMVLDAGEDTILGFAIVTRGELVRMAYVKREFRGNGFGLGLLAACGAGGEPPFRAHLPTASWDMWIRKLRASAT